MSNCGCTVSISDVARRARVSRSTVSLVLNEKGSISNETRRRVLRVCSDLRYRPHPTARFLPRLRRGSASPVETGVFAFSPAIAAGETATYSDFLDGVARVAVRQRKTVIYQPVGTEPNHPSLSQFGLDGRILVGRVNDLVLDFLRAENVPVVVIGDHGCTRPVWNVHVDCYAAGKLAVDYLWGIGHRRLALLCQARPAGYQTEFAHGFEDGLQRKGKLPGEYEILRQEDGSGLSMECLSRADRPSAVVAVEGGAARHVLLRAREAKLELPRDLSLLFFGRRPGPMWPLSATWIDPVSEEVGRVAMELALGLVGKPDQPATRTLLQPRVVEGETCRAV